MDTVVKISGVSKRFGRITALERIGFEVESGELFGCIGADGAGKTTLFRILCTLIVPDEGRAEVLGFDTVAGYRDIRRRIGYMPGRFSLYQDLSVEENLHFFATVFGTSVEENYDMIRDIYSHLEPFRKRKAAQLSGGMKQKLALSCALVHRPDLLLLDEPTTGVDAVSRREFWQMLRRLKENGITILVSTPYMDEASLCDRIAFLQDGRLLGIDRPSGFAGLYKRPLFSIKARNKYRLMTELRRFPHAFSVNAFGSEIHYSDSRPDPDPSEIQAWLVSNGITDALVTKTEPDIEDAFMMLIENET